MARRRKLSPERKEFINKLLDHYQPQDTHDVQEMLKDLLRDTLQGMLEAEMDEKLGYSKYDYKNKNTDDSRNGYSPKTVTSSMGTIDLDIPRDRKGEFEPQVVKKNQTDISYRGPGPVHVCKRYDNEGHLYSSSRYIWCRCFSRDDFPHDRQDPADC